MKRLALLLAVVGLALHTRADELDPARALLKRVIGPRADGFRIEAIAAQDGLDVFEVAATADKVVLRGNDPVAVASAFHEYLKHVANAQVSWCGDQLNLPDPLPRPAAPIRVVLPAKQRVYFNYCTLSYTAAWWDWKRWEREIDFMAMNGINMPLSVIGLEGVWYDTLRENGFTDAEARAFLVGPAWQAWQWMQNMEGYGGPLPKSWIDSHVTLGRKILARQRELGMTPIQQGFSGNVPALLQKKFPDAAMKQQPRWCNSFAGVMQLDPLDPLFAKLGSSFLANQRRLFGTSHYYGCDPFHESAPPKPGAQYLQDVGVAITALLTNHDPQAVWCMQSWSIRKEIATAVPRDRLLVLDLGGRWRSTDKFWGYPFVAGLIHNFGGRTRMCGSLSGLAHNPFAEARAAATNCTGLGLFPEAIEQNPVYYDLVFDLMPRTNRVDAIAWLHNYVTRRYGADDPAAQAAWTNLLATVYNSGAIYSSYLAARPALDVKMADPNTALGMPYDPLRVANAWGQLLSAADRFGGADGYRYDVVDLGRQVLADLGQPLHGELVDAYLDRDTNRFAAATRQLRELFADADRLTGTRPELSFRRWVRSAQAWATNEDERRQYTFAASMLVTHWGGDPLPHIFDYSWREWGGLIGGYYGPRWSKFHDELAARLATNGPVWTERGLPQDYRRPQLDANPFYHSLLEWEMAWINADRRYDADTQGDALATALEVNAKYAPLFERYFGKAGRERWQEQQDRLREQGTTSTNGVAVWRWKSGDVAPKWKDVTFDVTKALGVANRFDVVFLYESGGHRLHARNVEVAQDGTPVAKEAHEGQTGSGHTNNVWSFNLPMVVPAAKYTIRAEVRTDGGSDSKGTVWLRAR